MNTVVPAFRINMWTRANERCFLIHRLCSRIKDDQPQGYAALDWESILHGCAGSFGDYKELAVLPDKIARYLYEFHADSYYSHGLPPLPVDRSETDVHGILKPPQVSFWNFGLSYDISYLAYLGWLCYLFYLQNRALLNTLRKLRSTGGTGHIAIFNTLAIGHTKHPNEQRISSWPFAVKKLRGSNRQDFVFIRPPGISHGAFELRMDNVWFCKVLLLFQIESKTELGWKKHSCAFVSVMEEYNGPKRPGILLSLLIMFILLILVRSLIWLSLQLLYSAAWLDQCDSSIIYERRMQSQVLYVVPITSILGRLALVPVGDTGTIPFSMHKDTKDFPGASCDTKKDAGDGSRWWYINSWALKWATSQ